MPEGLGAHLSFPGLSLQDIAIAGHGIVPAEGAARYILQGWGYWRVSDAVSGLGRRSEENTGLQPPWGGWCEPKARGGSARVSHDPSRMGHSSKRQDSRETAGI